MATRKSASDPSNKRTATTTRTGKPASTVAEQRAIQQKIDAKPKKGGGSKAKKEPVQAGPRKQPQNPLPGQHQQKPGYEHELDPQPRYLAPDYRGSGKLEGMAAIISGGDSGIGRAVAVLFAREGCDVAVLHLAEPEDADVTRAAVEDEGRRCIVIAGDVKKTAFCEKAVKQTLKAFGRLDVLVNNAAFQQHAERIEDINDAQWEETLQTNIGGYFKLARAAIPHMQRGSSIINTGSEVALLGSAQLLDYSATKGAIVAFTRSLAHSLVEKKIRVNAVAPGPIWTPLIPSTFPGEEVKKFGTDVPMGRAGEPDEVAPCYVFLASDDSSYMTGQVLHPNGGEIVNG